MQQYDNILTAQHSTAKYQLPTICALATSPGGAIAIIRVSGTEAIKITSRIFRPKNGTALTDAKGYTLHYGEIRNASGESIDDVMVSVYQAPHSYTGENSTEIACHGSRYIVQQIIQALIDNGCRQAEPGEYTRRAFLNGKMDLSQAEAVADLIASTNKATHQMAMSQLKGHFSSELSLLREQLLKMTSLLELELDFSDHEELEFADRAELKALAQKTDERIIKLVRSFETGNAIKQGIPVAIVGKTNVGKSTLLNQLLHEDKAIVSDIHGTTRDVIEDTTQIHGLTFRFIDTAGIRQTTDVVEKLGIERTYQMIDRATIVIWMTDNEPTESEQKEMADKCTEKKLIMVRNKVDNLTSLAPTPQNPSVSSSIYSLSISAKYGLGIQALEEALYAAAGIPEISENDVIVTSVRHYEALAKAHDALLHVMQSMTLGLSSDLIAEDLKLVLQELGEITGGQINSQETLNNIFQHFCIGK